MNILLDENEEGLSKIFDIRDSSGRPALRIGLLATVFFEDPCTRAVREGVTDIAEAYIKQVRDHLRWAQQPKTARVYPIDSHRIKSPREWLPEHQDGKNWFWGFHGGESEDAASECQVSAFGSDDARKNLGYLQIHLPLRWLADKPGAFLELVLGICKRIRPLSGYGGIGLLEPLEISARDAFQPLVREMADRFPGLEVEDRVGHTNHVTQGIKGVNWLTILGDRWVETAGGRDYLRMHLTEDFTFYSYDGGLMIQAGHKPQLGDTQANRWPRHYVTLAKVLKKIQITNHYPFHFGGPGRMDKDASMAWLFRFDGK